MEIGSILNQRFRVDGRLGAGGMGEVYLGFDLRGDGPVAIKCLRVDLASHQEMFQRRFREEVDILKRLSFAGVPQFVEAFESDGQSILVMEFIQGHSLGVLLERAQADGARGLPARLVVRVGVEVCQILEHLHGHNPALVHRDIKPDNIIIRDCDERIFLVDFGLAREINGKDSTKTVVGTAAYAPLEQFQGKPEVRSDLYSLGVTLNQLLSGKSPTPLNVEPIQNLVPDVHEDLARIINRATRSGAEDRYPNAGDMRLLLEDVTPRLEEVQIPRPVVNPDDKVQELIRRWGRGKTAEPRDPYPRSSPVPTPVRKKSRSTALWGDDPVLRRNVARAGARAEWLFGQRKISDWVIPLLIVVALSGLVGAGLFWWSGREKPRTQADLVSEQYSLGAGWRVLEAVGLTPEGPTLGLGGGETSAHRCGFLLNVPGKGPLLSLTAGFRKIQGSGRLLLFASPWGVLVEPRKERCSARVVTVEAAPSIDALAPKNLHESPPVAINSGAEIRLQLRFSSNKGYLIMDGNTIQSFHATQTPLTSPSRCAGAVMLDLSKGSKCMIKSWRIL